jgi:hypothetical protein
MMPRHGVQIKIICKIIYKITLFLAIFLFILLIIGMLPVFRGVLFYVYLLFFAPALWICWIAVALSRQIKIIPFKIIILWVFINIVMLLFIISPLLHSINIAEAQGNDLFITMIYFPIDFPGFAIIYPIGRILDKFIDYYFGTKGWVGAFGIWLFMLIIIIIPSLLIGYISYMSHSRNRVSSDL